MLKKSALIFTLIFSASTMIATNNNFNFKHLSAQQLLDTGNYFFNKNNADMALLCYDLLINSPVKDTDIEQQKKMVEAYMWSAIIYTRTSDFRTAYELLIKALLLSEKTNYDAFLPRIYNVIAEIYNHYNKDALAKMYYTKALLSCRDSSTIIVILSNIGGLEVKSGNLDSAYYYLNQSLQISKRHNDTFMHSTLNSLASYYQKIKQYDTALHYYQLSLIFSKKNKVAIREADNLSQLAKLFFEDNKIDSALYYIRLSNDLATKHNFLGILAKNFLTLSKIEETKGETKKAFEYHKKYTALKDSVYNAEKFGDINQLQRMYEVSKTNQQIEQLCVEQQIKERTIRYQRIFWFITLCVLLLVSIGLLYIYLQKRNLSTAYKILFEKNIEIIELQEDSPQNYSKKIKKIALAYNIQVELLDKILALMEETSIICDTEFTIDKLAELVQSNSSYVSQIINSDLKKNFRSFINSYRIREAQRLFSEPDATKYTIESVALRVGFKSQTAFRDAFKEITGVSPNFYLKSYVSQAKQTW
jgi:AraC-like DNA-binding protein/Tfp pilus assembly protein PilF